MLKKIFSGILAGLLISIGGTVFLSCSDKVVGSVAFTIGLLAVCYYGANLYTGRIGYLFDKHDKEALTDLVFGLLGNLIATTLCGLLLGPMKGESAVALCGGKLTQAPLETLLRAAFCGILSRDRSVLARYYRTAERQAYAYAALRGIAAAVKPLEDMRKILFRKTLSAVLHDKLRK